MRDSIRLAFVSVVLLLFGAFLMVKAMPDDGPVKCGDQVMQPGDYCGVGRPYSPDGTIPSNYEEYAAKQRAGDTSQLLSGSAFMLGGVGVLGLLLWMRRRAAS